MLSQLEEIRKKIGREEINRHGYSVTNMEMLKLFVDNAQEFKDNYILRGHMRAMDTVLDIPDCIITGIYHDWCDNSISIHRKGIIKGSYMNDLCLRIKEYEKADIVVWYSECDWIDIHIRASKDDYSNSICLCFLPKGKGV